MRGKKFIDLFAGIGGFHLAGVNQGMECVFACEVDKKCQEVYKDNFGIEVKGDIRDVKEEEIPSFDMLFAGFPCQSFSKAGQREGFEDKTRGTLFYEIMRIIRYHKPRYILLENVKNLATHDKGNTWRIIREELEKAGYKVGEKPIIISPYHYGVPQNRERVFIVSKRGKSEIKINKEGYKEKKENKISGIIEVGNEDESLKITEREQRILEIWDKFVKEMQGENIKFPIWVDVFTGEEDITEETKPWRIPIIKKNKELYKKRKETIDRWLEETKIPEEDRASYRRLEWQAGDEYSSIRECIVQFRPSGVRVRRPDVFPTLVAMKQIPIYAKEGRYLSVRECARLQSFPDSFKHSKSAVQAYKQLGNSVNVKVVEEIIKQIRGCEDDSR